MASINELKEQLGYIEIGLNDTFTFHCTQCGKCCIHQEDILLSPKDLFNIAKKFQITPKDAFEQYCESYIGSNSRFPIVRLKPRGNFYTWTKTQATLCKHLHLLKKSVPDKIMLGIWNAILISLYLNYEITEDFQTQFRQNSDAILSLIETLRTVDVLVSNKN